MTPDEARDLLRSECEKVGSQAAWGTRHAISRAHVCGVLSGRKEMGDRMQAALGLRRVITYEPVRRRATQRHAAEAGREEG